MENKISNVLELRIENLVLNRHNEVHRFGFMDFMNYRHPQMGGYYGFCAIPLTEEWLIKLGFEQQNGITVWKKEIQYIDESYPASLQLTNNGTAMQICRAGIGAACAPCFYVHQLQNLYFALTGEELTIKL